MMRLASIVGQSIRDPRVAAVLDDIGLSITCATLCSFGSNECGVYVSVDEDDYVQQVLFKTRSSDGWDAYAGEYLYGLNGSETRGQIRELFGNPINSMNTDIQWDAYQLDDMRVYFGYQSDQLWEIALNPSDWAPRKGA